MVTRMLVSHSRRFVLFCDPLGACPWISHALAPWLDQPIARDLGSSGPTTLFDDMSPKEAEFAFDMMGFAYRNYTRIAVVRNPIYKMSQLYDRIAATDRIWQLRRNLGASDPDFGRWLRSTRPDGLGAGHKSSPRWRRFGAWSAKEWCGDHITHTVRAECAKRDLTQVFAEIGLAPAFGGNAGDAPKHLPRRHQYDDASTALINDRYAWDFRIYNSYAPDLHLVA